MGVPSGRFESVYRATLSKSQPQRIVVLDIGKTITSVSNPKRNDNQKPAEKLVALALLRPSVVHRVRTFESVLSRVAT